MGDDFKGHYSDACRYHDINEQLFFSELKIIVYKSQG